MLEIKYRLWLDAEGEKIFGAGPIELLKGIKASGSLSAASKQMGMSYSKAWNLIKRLETHLGLSLVEKRVGGVHGGGAILTPEAVMLIERFETLSTEVEAYVASAYEKHLGEWLRSKKPQTL
jgi:molybdate transport system regulatory protein